MESTVLHTKGAAAGEGLVMHTTCAFTFIHVAVSKWHLFRIPASKRICMNVGGVSKQSQKKKSSTLAHDAWSKQSEWQLFTEPHDGLIDLECFSERRSARRFRQWVAYWYTVARAAATHASTHDTMRMLRSKFFSCFSFACLSHTDARRRT